MIRPVSPLLGFNPFDLPPPPPKKSLKSRFLLKPKKIDINPIDDLELILNILCINCQDLVNVEKIQEHSDTCIKISQAVLSVESGSMLEEIYFKRSKLKNCLQEVLKNSSLKPGDKNYVLILLRLDNAVGDSIDQLDHAIESLSSLLITFKGSLSIRVYIDRFFSLIAYQKTLLTEQNKLETPQIDTFMMEPLETKDINSSELENKLNYYTSKAEEATRLHFTNKISVPKMSAKLEAINSDFNSVNTSLSVTSSLNNFDEPASPMPTQPRLETDEELKKYFYSICLSQKIKVSSTKKNAPSLSISKMFNAVRSENIPTEMWWDFIIKQFDSPSSKYLEGVPRRNLFVKKKQAFEIIVEEDN
jgi:hypothetical protein